MSPPDSAPGSRSLAERLFRVSGVLPLAVFALLHVAMYAAAPQQGHGFGARGLALALELLLVLAPLVYHAGYGFWLSLRGARPQAASLFDRVQRWTAPLLFVFLVDHVVRLRVPRLRGLVAVEDSHAFLVRELSATWEGVPAVAAFQCAGIAVLAFHLGYGLYRSPLLSLRGLGTPRARAGLAWGVGLFVLLFGSFAVIGLATGKSFPFV